MAYSFSEFPMFASCAFPSPNPEAKRRRVSIPGRPPAGRRAGPSTPVAGEAGEPPRRPRAPRVPVLRADRYLTGRARGGSNLFPPFFCWRW